MLSTRAVDRIRTGDLFLGKEAFYQLNYYRAEKFQIANCKLYEKKKICNLKYAICNSSLRGWDLNPRPQGYEPCELPDCSTPRRKMMLRTITPQAEDPWNLSCPPRDATKLHFTGLYPAMYQFQIADCPPRLAIFGEAGRLQNEN